jgi:Glycosyl transferase family 2
MPSSPADRPPRRPRRISPSVSIVIPIRDAAGLPPMLRTLPPVDEVIVVTAGPGQDAAVLAACPGALLVRQTRTGLGNALACGFATATGDVLVTLDGDGATDPGELPRYVEALLAGADVAFGSRYRDGGRDLTAGRFRRALNLLLAWLLNMLYRTRRTDPGFGYAAFRRDALDRLALPDPTPAAPAVWGDGPEIEALLAVRAAARGLTVTEVPGVAYPRMRRSAHADRTTAAHWLRALFTEFHGRTARPPRHSAAVVTPFARPAPPPPRPLMTPPRPLTHPAVTPPRPLTHPAVTPPRPLTRPAVTPPRPSEVPPAPERRSLPNRRVPLSERRSAAAPERGKLSTGAPHDLQFSARIEIGGGPRRPANDQVPNGEAGQDRAAHDEAAHHKAAQDQLAEDQIAKNKVAKYRLAKDQAAGHDQVGPVEPIWGPARRTPDPANLGLADIPAPLDRLVPPTPDKPIVGSAPPHDKPVIGSAPPHDKPVIGSAPPYAPVPRPGPATPPARPTLDKPVIASAPPHLGPPVIASVPPPRTGKRGRRRDDQGAEAGGEEAAAEQRRETQTAEQRREVGTRRRHLEDYRPRPDLRVINGEGAGGGRSRSGRLRAVPPREITGGRPGPQ